MVASSSAFPLPPPVPPVPLIPRLWAALAGGDLGTDPVSRAVAVMVRTRFPDAPAQVAAARRFHSSAARQAVTDDGIRSVIFAEAGVPVVRQGAAGSFPLHAEAARPADAARFCYADPDGEAVLLNSTLYRGDRVDAVRGSVRGPREIVEASGLTPPLHAQIQAVLTWVPDEEARDIIAGWAAVLGAGGSLALSLTIGGRETLPGLPPAQNHSAARVRSWLTGAGLTVAEPGVAPVQTWPFGSALSRRAPRICGVLARRG